LSDVYVKKETVHRSETRMWGSFYLSDKTRTKFDFDSKSGDWNQWNNTTENLGVTVERVEELVNDFMEAR
jgi:hypothetical protein